MSDIQISATLKTMSDALQTLSQSLENEKTQHIELLKKLNLHLSSSQEIIENNISNFLEKIELTELINTVNESRNNIEKQKDNVYLLNEQVKLISEKINTSIAILEQKSKNISNKIQEDSNLIQSTIVKNVSIAVKEQILNSFNSQFEEQNDFLLAQIKKANLVALNNVIETYNHLIQQATAVKEKHKVDLQQFQNHVDKFNKNINLAIDHVGNAFLEVEKNCRDNMNVLYDSCANFQNRVIEKLNAETAQINEIFDQKISDISKAVQDSCANTLQTMSNTEQQINQKSKQLTSVLEENANVSLGMTQKIIEKQENIYKNLCKKLNFKYFSFNSISILIVTLVILCGLNIAATMRYEKMKNYSTALVNQSQKLQSDIKDLEAAKHDLIILTKQSVNEMRKKFPQLQIAINCKSLD
jgi:hypothetical protein